MNPALPKNITSKNARRGWVNNVFDSYYKKYDAWYDKNKKIRKGLTRR